MGKSELVIGNWAIRGEIPRYSWQEETEIYPLPITHYQQIISCLQKAAKEKKNFSNCFCARLLLALFYFLLA